MTGYVVLVIAQVTIVAVIVLAAWQKDDLASDRQRGGMGIDDNPSPWPPPHTWRGGETPPPGPLPIHGEGERGDRNKTFLQGHF